MSFDEKRSFIRYTKSSECELKAGNETFRGKVLDYSADGASATFENAQVLTIGTKADLTIFDSDIHFKCKVVWIQESEEGPRIGLKRVDRLAGSLKNFNFADIVIGLQKTTRTGILSIESSSIIVMIHISNGDMIFAISNRAEDRLGEILLKTGMITLEQYNQSKVLMKEGKERVGRIFVRLGLAPKRVFLAVKHQIQETILNVFNFQEGKFEFEEGPLPTEELITLKMSAANLIYRGIKRVKSFLPIEQVCPPQDSILTFSDNPQNIFQDITIDEEDKGILSYVDGMKSLRDILNLSLVKNFEVLKTICAFLYIRLIRVRSEDEPVVKAPIEDIVGKPPEEITYELLNRAETLSRSIQYLDHYEILEVTRDAPVEEITMKYYRLSKQFHPDRHFSVPSEDIKEKLIKIQFHVTEAYKVLSDQKSRDEYNRTLPSVSTGTAQEVTESEGPLEDAGREDRAVYAKGTEPVVGGIAAEPSPGHDAGEPDIEEVNKAAQGGEVLSDSEEKAPDERVLSDEDVAPGQKVYEFDKTGDVSEDEALPQEISEIHSGEQVLQTDEAAGTPSEAVHESLDTADTAQDEIETVKSETTVESIAEHKHPGIKAEESQEEKGVLPETDETPAGTAVRAGDGTKKKGLWVTLVAALLIAATVLIFKNVTRDSGQIQSPAQRGTAVSAPEEVVSVSTEQEIIALPAFRDEALDTVLQELQTGR